MAAYDWWDVICVILLLAGVGGGCFMQGCLRLVECYVCHLAIGWRVWGRWSLSGSTGRLPQIIKIGKFHAWLLMIGGMFCVPSCYWVLWSGQVRESLQIIECLLVIGVFMVCEGGPGLWMSVSDLDPYQEQWYDKAWKGLTGFFKTSPAIGWN